MICDYRHSSVEAVKAALKSKVYEHFIDEFNKFAYIKIKPQGDDIVLIELKEPIRPQSNFMFWVAIGIDKYVIPDYRFIIKEMMPLEKEYALLSLYARP